MATLPKIAFANAHLTQSLSHHASWPSSHTSSAAQSVQVASYAATTLPIAHHHEALSLGNFPDWPVIGEPT